MLSFGFHNMFMGGTKHSYLKTLLTVLGLLFPWTLYGDYDELANIKNTRFWIA